MRRLVPLLALLLIPSLANAQGFIHYYPPPSTGTGTWDGGAFSAAATGPTGCASPSYSFTGDTTAGMCLLSANNLVLTTAGGAVGTGHVALSATAATLYFYDAGGLANGLQGLAGSATVFTNDIARFTLTTTAATIKLPLTIGDSAADDLFTFDPPDKGTTSFAATFSSADLTAARSWTWPDVSGTPQVNLAASTAAPSATECDAANEVGRLYHQTGDPATVNLQLFRCTQTGPAGYTWLPAGYYSGTSCPATCTAAAGPLCYDTDDDLLKSCTADNTWTAVGGGMADPGANGLMVRTAANTSIARTLLAGTGITVANGTGVSGDPIISADSAVVNFFTIGTGSPPATCTAGKDIYVETDQLRACICSATNTWTCNGKLRAHATDCTALTDGLADEMCFERDANTLYVCEPTAGGCDTAGEWTAVGGSGAPTDAKYIVAETNGSLSAEVAPSAADQVPVSDSTSAATWQTLPNGTVSYNTSTNAFSVAQVVPKPNAVRWSYCGPAGGGVPTLSCSGATGVDVSAAVSGLVAPTASDGMMLYNETTASSGNQARSRGYGDNQRVGRSNVLQAYIRLPSTASIRVWVGWFAGSTTDLQADDPAFNLAMLRYSTNASDTNWKCVTNDATGGGTINDSGVAVSTSSINLEIVETNATNFKFYINGTLVCTNSTNLPATVNWAWMVENETLTTAAKQLEYGYVYLESSK